MLLKPPATPVTVPAFSDVIAQELGTLSAVSVLFPAPPSMLPVSVPTLSHADGHFVDVEAIANNLLEIPGIDGIVTTTRSITERRKVEQAMKESEERYRAIFEGSADALFLMDDRFRDCNPEAERMLGWSHDDIIGHEIVDFSPERQPDGQQSRDAAAAHLHAAFDSSVQVFPWVHRRKDGTLIDTEVSLRAVTVSGERRLIAIVRDVTGLNRAEQQVRRLASFPDLNPDPVIEINLRKEITYANPASYSALRLQGMPEDPAAFIPADADGIIQSISQGNYESLYREDTCRRRAVRRNHRLFPGVLRYPDLCA